MHARKKGKSGSSKPIKSESDKWLEYNNEEITKFIVELAKDDKGASQIGTILRDQYGVADVKAITGKKITTILEENKLAGELPEGFENLLRRALKLRKHLEKNPHDNSNNRGFQLTESKIKRQIKYYKGKGTMEPDFYYRADQIELLLR